MSFMSHHSIGRRLAIRAFSAATAAALSVTAVGVSAAQANPGKMLATHAQTVESVSPAALAVAQAWALVGKPYRWGGVGPRAYDCSGSTLTSWRAAGVELPRTSRDQYQYLTPGAVRLPVSERQAGDLVFFSSRPGNPARIYHVAILLDRDHMMTAGRAGLRVVPFHEGLRNLMPEIVRP